MEARLINLNLALVSRPSLPKPVKSRASYLVQKLEGTIVLDFAIAHYLEGSVRQDQAWPACLDGSFSSYTIIKFNLTMNII